MAVLLEAVLCPGTIFGDSLEAQEKEVRPAIPAETSGEAATPTDLSDNETSSTEDLTLMSLEDLSGLNVFVTSSAKKAESLRNATSAIFVITQEDIRRSGAQHLADLLLMVPGLQVARQSANEWAVSARGFNGNFNNKMLVLIDGRSVYDPVFGGVTWNEQNIPMAEIDHLEVIRGPGGTLWGANAMNGMVNVITKNSKVTQGVHVSGAGGYPLYDPGATGTTAMNGSVFARYGGKWGEGFFYRVHVQAENREPSEDPAGGAWHDDGYDFRGGFRADWHTTQDTLTLMAEAQSSFNGYERLNTNGFAVFNPRTFTAFSDINTNIDRNAHILGRWIHDFKDHSQIQVQAYYDHNDRTTANDSRNTSVGQADIEYQHRFNLNGRNEIIYGVSYRHYSTRFLDPINFVYSPDDLGLDIYGGFLQDKITLVPARLFLIGGAKLEYNSYTNEELQPSGRLLWTPDAKNSAWAAVSRAVRIPSQFSDAGYLYLAGVRPGTPLPPPYGPVTQPIYAGVIPNHDLAVESLTSYELGYRTDPSQEISIDIAFFYNHYENLYGFARLNGQYPAPNGGVFRPLTPLAGSNPSFANFVVLQQQNMGVGNIYGAELSGTWDPAPNLHWGLGYTYQSYDQNMIDASSPTFGAPPPHNLIHTRLSYEPIHELELNAAFHYTDATFLYNNLQGAAAFVTAPYIQWNLGGIWRASANWEIALWAMDLEGSHTETLPAFGVAPTLVVPRFYGRFTMRY